MTSFGTISTPLRKTQQPVSVNEGASRPGPLVTLEKPRITVIVVDGQAVFRSGLAYLLGQDQRLDVVATSDGGPEVVEMCTTMSVDVVVTDIRLPRMDGIDFIRLLQEASPDTRVLVVASAADWGVIPALTSGAAGFLLKDAEPEAILSAVVAIHLGEQVFCREATEWAKAGIPARRLTKREIDVLRMVAQGADNREIAELLQLGEKTVRNYVSRLYRKLAVHSRSQIASYVPRSEQLDGRSSDAAKWMVRRSGRFKEELS